MTKQGSKRDVLEEILLKNEFRNARSEDNKVTFEGDEFKIRNRVTKKEKEAVKEVEQNDEEDRN